MKKRYEIESEFKHEDLLCVVIMLSTGHRCGYVGVNENSKLFEVNYSDKIKSKELLNEIKNTTIGKRGIISCLCWDGDSVSPDILFNVHGGITYSDGNNYPIKKDYKLWWFGFDCAHFGDAKDWDSVKKYFPKKQWESIWKIEQEYSFDRSLSLF